MTDYIIPEGFSCCGKHVGIKKRKLDLGVVFSQRMCNAAAVFTKNKFCGVPIIVGKENIKDNKLQAIIVTSGVANVATGDEGLNNTHVILKKLSEELDIDEKSILPSSTGIIGKQLPIDNIIKGMDGIKEILSKDKWEDFNRAIMTTDKELKIKSCKVGNASILGVGKGSGMIEPNMATMLVYFFTDAYIPGDELKSMLKRVTDKSFNMISIDHDTSTSDTAAILANGYAGEVDLKLFEEVLTNMCIDISKDIVKDGEGVSKLIEVTVKGCRNFKQAKVIGKSVINSPLVKIAVYGADANWGRIAMAVGKTFDDDVDPFKIQIAFNSILVYDKGKICEENVCTIENYLKKSKECKLQIDLNIGDSSATVWGADLTEEYVRINSYYTKRK
ncbi:MULTISPECIES: bifunctional glutamate N-acetyltransferase/amino-acid acetyltransferase ArgJ [Clostridium]|uniref:bifunctional glutamate N-acetyltransferase/amino-acid acetyltransferase ArgJ n=1 Tax=Clostridium TaxID=1485 RepID=UPI0008267BE6|nr:MULTISPECIES: bifunctional glutamate N-acetyltransferase/amino-acid acetyltransferase ArgJ [Clostridium]PJI08984.1 bifunctional glutamate N-acetyltransferase/amino-acid acetyltransferase ArgJ [Clostridium sp. CT7]